MTDLEKLLEESSRQVLMVATTHLITVPESQKLIKKIIKSAYDSGLCDGLERAQMHIKDSFETYDKTIKATEEKIKA